MIEIRNLSKNYGKVKALDKISINFEEGLVYGIIGSNGAGKTTLFECMAGLINYSGDISYPKTDMRIYTGFLPTVPDFLSLITAREYLQLLCNARRIPNPNFRESNIFDLPLNRFISAYSTGMKKKLAFTGILMQKNELYLLDEPFNGVDLQSNIMLIEIIRRLKQANKTVIISSHILSALSEVCDRFILLKNGAVYRDVDKQAFHLIEKELIQTEIRGRLSKLVIK
ncbi:MAG: ATP-binding cassette domain-containing protein [Candidatus Cloacimonetes bacterium]|nr:ATP-binding cassette domain-containing protein [Candidatus Cloacimonadota bacterium]